MPILNLNNDEMKPTAEPTPTPPKKKNIYASRSKIPLKHKSSLLSSGITNLRWPEDDTAWGRNGWKEKQLTVSAQQTEQEKSYYSYKNEKYAHESEQ